MKFWNTQSFKTLQKEWYRRLQSEGFRDIEEIINGDFRLKQSAAQPIQRLDALERTSREAYYRLLLDQAEKEAFRSPVDRLILIMFGNGAKIKAICAELDAKGWRRGRDTVRFTIRKYEMRWGLREYSAKQLHKRVS